MRSPQSRETVQTPPSTGHPAGRVNHAHVAHLWPAWNSSHSSARDSMMKSAYAFVPTITNQPPKKIFFSLVYFFFSPLFREGKKEKKEKKLKSKNLPSA
jgi:hypothetical protein